MKMKIRPSNGERVYNEHTEGIPFLSFDMLDRLGIPNLFSTRFESYDEERGTGEVGFRTSLMRGEDIYEVAPVITRSRDRLARQLGSSVERECFVDQKHSNHVIVVKPEDLGRVEPGKLPLHRQFADGMVTDVPDALLTVFGGDCPPVYLADPVRKACGLVHAGWRGTLARIPAVAIAQMVVHFGSDPKDIYAAIGPGICKDCYEMGDEVYDAFADEWGKEDADHILERYKFGTESEAFKLLKRQNRKQAEASEESIRGKYHLDLREANRLTLLQAGVPENHIVVSNVCTMCNVETFYSYRAGRMENEQAAMLVNRFSCK